MARHYGRLANPFGVSTGLIRALSSNLSPTDEDHARWISSTPAGSFFNPIAILFHEAAHLLLHSKKNVFVDETNRNGDELENEANAWAAKSLLPLDAWNRFVVAGDYRAPTVRQFAQEQGIAPGIVVGKLQHERLLSWNRLNGLEVRLRWADSSSQ